MPLAHGVDVDRRVGDVGHDPAGDRRPACLTHLAGQERVEIHPQSARDLDTPLVGHAEEVISQVVDPAGGFEPMW